MVRVWLTVRVRYLRAAVVVARADLTGLAVREETEITPRREMTAAAVAVVTAAVRTESPAEQPEVTVATTPAVQATATAATRVTVQQERMVAAVAGVINRAAMPTAAMVVMVST